MILVIKHDSVVQPPFGLQTSTGHWVVYGNLRSGLPVETIALPVLVCSEHTAPRNIKLAKTPHRDQEISCAQRNSR